MALTLFRITRPFENLAGWTDEIDHFFDDAFRTERPKTDWHPPIDIQHHHNGYVLKADLPGVKKEDIRITLENGYLTLAGERQYGQVENRDHYHRIERSYGKFQRSFKVPDGIGEKDIQAKYRDGVLELKIPLPKPEAPKKIKVHINS